MSTIEVHEPEVKELQIKPSTRAAAVLPRADLVMGSALPPRAMFSDSLLEFGVQRKRRFFATTTSFVLNCVVIVTMLAVPLMFTEELPKAQLLTFLMAPPPPPPPPPPAAAEAQKVVHQIQTDMLSTGGLRTPSRIPQKIQMIKEDEAPPAIAVGGVVGGVPGGIPGGQLNGVIGGIVSATSNLSAVPRVTLAAPTRIRISQGVTKGLLIHREEPAYPPLARSARVQGDVVLSAVIGTNGEIQNLQLVSGHPMLVPAALAAVRLWRYKPYLLNGTPVEVETTITVIFTLSS
ncbi:MAG: energy transducer TonB [Candidatus Sulfotelmatobacter sp.]